MVGRLRPWLERAARGTVYAVLVAAPIALGGRPSWAAAPLETVALLGLLLWILHMLGGERIEWRRSALDRPVAMLLALVLVQIAIGNGSFVAWALGSPATAGEPLPAPFLAVGTISPRTTLASLVLFVAYVAVYLVVVNVFRRRRHVEAVIRVLLVVGTALAIFALVDYFAHDVVRWRDGPRRAVATWVNADHFGAWINMVVFLTLGWLLVHSPRPPAQPAGGAASGWVESVARQYAIIGALAVMVLALVFTLSRGAILSFIVALIVVMILATVVGLARRAVVGVGILLAVVLGYGAWLGLGPLLGRLHESHTVSQRLGIYAGALRLLGDFPILGIGLGTYPEISYRYQNLSLGIGEMWLNAAHSDWLQLLVETGVFGLGIVVYAIARTGRDLIGAHLIGQGRCPVHGGEDEWARRHDPFSVGVSLGALGAVASLLAHSAVDFSARMPANGFLAAACLGIATTALHTRFGTDDGFLAARWTWSVPTPGVARLAAAVACLATVALSVIALRPAVVDAVLGASHVSQPGAVETVLSAIGNEPRAVFARANRTREIAHQVWATGIVGVGQPVGPLEDRRREATRLLQGAARDVRDAISAVPSSTIAHTQLASIYQSLAQIDGPNAASHAAAAVAHLNRAIALAPDHPLLHRTLALLVVDVQPYAPVELGLIAARNAVQRRPDALPDLLYAYLGLPLSDDQWSRFVPDTLEDRLVLADLLEQRRLVREATAVYERAIEIANPLDAPVARWILARSLVRQNDHAGALRQLGLAMQASPANAELQMATAETLAMMREAAALDMYRTAVTTAETNVRAARAPSQFTGYRGRLGDLVSRQLGTPASGLGRYRRALARHLAGVGLWQQALQQSDLAVAENPRDGLGHFVRGMALEGLGRAEDALQAFGTAVSLDGANTAFRLRLAKVLIQTNQPFQAINQWTAVLENDPGNVDAALGIARTYLQRGAKMDAFRAYQQVLRIAPDNPEARSTLVRFGWVPQ